MAAFQCRIKTHALAVFCQRCPCVLFAPCVCATCYARAQAVDSARKKCTAQTWPKLKRMQLARAREIEQASATLHSCVRFESVYLVKYNQRVNNGALTPPNTAKHFVGVGGHELLMVRAP